VVRPINQTRKRRNAGNTDRRVQLEAMGNVCSSANSADEKDTKAKSSEKQSKAIARGPTFRYEDTLLGLFFFPFVCP